MKISNIKHNFSCPQGFNRAQGLKLWILTSDKPRMESWFTRIISNWLNLSKFQFICKIWNSSPVLVRIKWDSILNTNLLHTKCQVSTYLSRGMRGRFIICNSHVQLYMKIGSTVSLEIKKKIGWYLVQCIISSFIKRA